MTTAEKLLMIAETLHAVRGSWSANEVLETARRWGLSVRRSAGLNALENGPADRRQKGVKMVPARCANGSQIELGHAKEPINKGREPFEHQKRRRRKKRPNGSEPINKGREPFEGVSSTIYPQAFPENLDSTSDFAVPPCTPLDLCPDIATISSETTSRSSVYFVNVANKKRVRARKNSKDGTEPKWLLSLRDAVKSLEARTLCSLMVPERIIVARYHAFRFCNCVRSARGNHLTATSRIAPGLAGLAADPRFGSLTVRQYVALGDAVLARRGRVPFFSAWAVIGAAEIERARCALAPMWPHAGGDEPLQLALEIGAL